MVMQVCYSGSCLATTCDAFPLSCGCFVLFSKVKAVGLGWMGANKHFHFTLLFLSTVDIVSVLCWASLQNWYLAILIKVICQEIEMPESL